MNTINDIIINSNENSKYVVVRDGRRVSDREYILANDLSAIAEKSMWERISNKNSHGEKVEIVKYDPLKHTI